MKRIWRFVWKEALQSCGIPPGRWRQVVPPSLPGTSPTDTQSILNSQPSTSHWASFILKSEICFQTSSEIKAVRNAPSNSHSRHIVLCSISMQTALDMLWQCAIQIYVSSSLSSSFDDKISPLQSVAVSWASILHLTVNTYTLVRLVICLLTMLYVAVRHVANVHGHSHLCSASSPSWSFQPLDILQSTTALSPSPLLAFGTVFR